jgi:hypothetical protein
VAPKRDAGFQPATLYIANGSLISTVAESRATMGGICWILASFGCGVTQERGGAGALPRNVELVGGGASYVFGEIVLSRGSGDGFLVFLK